MGQQIMGFRTLRELKTLLALALGIGVPVLGYSQPGAAYEEAPIHYSETATANRADMLALAIKAIPDRQLPLDGRKALDRLLKEFSVPVSSQVLVFSKTSLQIDRIAPHNPRALYFSDDTYIGYVPGGILELTLHDPQLGLLFYEVRPKEQIIRRNRDCLSCHAGSRTDHWPGILIRSVFPRPDGHPITSTSSYLTTHSSPLSERWGGWYVTGHHGAGRHLGNLVVSSDQEPHKANREPGANITDLSPYFDTDRYPLNQSDIVALMVLEHQCEMHNRLSRGMLRARKWMLYQAELDRSLGRPVSEKPTGTARTVIRGEAERIVDYLLFREEAALPEGGIHGNTDFQDAFRANRKSTKSGKSLKDFDLQSRLFTHRCSYMIYSAAFDSIPESLRNEVYRQLAIVLNSQERTKRFAYLTQSERHQIRQILIETKPEIQAYL